MKSRAHETMGKPHVKARVLIVDGYNVLGAMPDAKGQSIDDARDRLTDMLRDYAGCAGQQVTVVYDAWRSDRKARSVERMGNLTVVFTRHGETADQHIERLTDGLKPRVLLDQVEVRVATSDNVEQTVILGRGATRVSARELLLELDQVRLSAQTRAKSETRPVRATVMEQLNPAVRQKLEQMRRGE